MKTSIRVVTTGLLVVMLAGLVVFCLPVQTVQAAGLQDENPPQGQPNGEGQFQGIIKQRLERILEREERWLERQGERIQKMDEVVTKAQARINILREKGLDTTPLEAALDAFEAKIPAIQTAHNLATDILADHIGFGDNGKVKDIEAARVTVKNAGAALKEASELMKGAARELSKAWKEFRLANPPAPTPKA